MECRRRTNSSAVGSMHRALSVAVTQILRKIPYETDCLRHNNLKKQNSATESRPYAFEEKGTCPSTPHRTGTRPYPVIEST